MREVFIAPEVWAQEIIKAANEKKLCLEDIDFQVNSLMRCGNKGEIGDALKLILRNLIV